MDENAQRYFMSVLWCAYTVHLRELARDEETEIDLAKRAENRAGRRYLERFVAEGPNGPNLRRVVLAALDQVQGKAPATPSEYRGEFIVLPGAKN